MEVSDKVDIQNAPDELGSFRNKLGNTAELLHFFLLPQPSFIYWYWTLILSKP